MAVSPRVDPVDEFLSDSDIARSCDELSDFFPREAAEANVVEPLGSRQLRQGAGERTRSLPDRCSVSSQ